MKNQVNTVSKKTNKKAQIIILGKATELILGNGNKRSESNKTPQITNIERCAA